MTDTVLFILEIVGTAVFAASGALAGLQRQLDAFGVVILGVCTACGGGVIRDLTLGITPPVMFCQPVYALVAMGVSALVFLPAVRHLLAVESRAYELVMLWLDSIGLGLFTVVGVQCAFQQAQDYNLFLLVFVGVITGVGGGVLRDVLSNQKPYIFVKHFYACPTLIGALLCALCWRHLGDIPSMLLGAAVILVLRLCAAHFRWGLPHAAAALSYLIQGSPKPIVLTGAQKPIWFDGTDSKRNLTDAFLYACRGCGRFFSALLPSNLRMTLL